MEAYQRLEAEFGEFVQREHTVACSSGTAALHLAFEVLRKVEGWEPSTTKVLVPDLTMVACPRAVKAAGLNVAIQDVDDRSGMLQYLGVSHKDVKAALAVHLYGRPCTYGDAKNVDDKTIVVNDLAEHPSRKTRPSELACWSFYKNKIIRGEEGGMIAFRDKEEADLARKLRNMGTEDGLTFEHAPRGMNYRMSNVHAGLILDSLHEWHWNLRRRIQVEGQYSYHLDSVLGQGQWEKLSPRDSPWVYDFGLPQGVGVQDVVKGMNKLGIPARCYFKPIRRQPEFLRPDGLVTSADLLYAKRMYLPIEPEFDQDNFKKVREICAALRLVLEYQKIKTLDS